MVEYKVKYKISSFFILSLILIVVVTVLYLNFSYLVGTETKVAKTTEVRVTEQEMSALEQIKTLTIDNPEYKQFVPVAESETPKADPSVKANPFQNKDQKE